MAAVNVAVAGNRLGVLFYELRNDHPLDGETDVWFMSAPGGAQSNPAAWKEHHVAGPFDVLDINSVPLCFCTIGDNQGLAGTREGFVSAYTLGEPLSTAGPMDIFFSRIDRSDRMPKEADPAPEVVPVGGEEGSITLLPDSSDQPPLTNDALPAPQPAATACSDGIDNDEDGLFDYGEEPGCDSLDDATETAPPQCTDGIDNDEDGKFDFGQDSGCDSTADNDEDEPVAMP